jgi:hypothetical protein
MWIRFLEQLKSLKTNGKRKNVQSIFLILKFKYVEDLTLDLSDKKNRQKYPTDRQCNTTSINQPSLVYNTQPTTVA